MGNILKILKINILSIIALHILLLATASKLIAKALEKLAVVLGMTCFTLAICAFFEILKKPQNILTIIAFILVFIIVIAAFVTLLQMFMSAYAPDGINKALGIFIPLIVVNCIILGRAESFACKHTPLESLCDGVGIGLGFTFGLTLLGVVRELLGAGSVFGVVLLPETTNMLLFILPPGAFITLGYLIAIFNRFKAK